MVLNLFSMNFFMGNRYFVVLHHSDFMVGLDNNFMMSWDLYLCDGCMLFVMDWLRMRDNLRDCFNWRCLSILGGHCLLG